MDKAHNLTDEKLKEIEKKLSKIYSSAQKDIQQKADDYFKKFEADDMKKRNLLEKGEITDEQYRTWRSAKIAYGKRFTALKKDIANQLLNVNQTAVAYVNGTLPEIYSLSYNALKDQVDGIGGYSFTLVDPDTVKNLSLSDGSLLPYKKIDPLKDIPWNMKNINAEVLQGIIQGESIPKISKRIMNVQEMNEHAAVRTARTIVTGAENKGRMDSYHRAEEDGIILEKEWLSAIDSRTRDWHAELNGKTALIDEPFENSIGKIMFPGDPSADGANVYNCRCTLVARVKGFKNAQVQNAMEEVIETAPKTMSEHYKVLETNEEKIDFISKSIGVSREQAEEYEASIAQYGGFSFGKIRQASYFGGEQFDEEVYSGKLVISFNKIAQNIEEFIEKSPKWNGEIYRGINLPHDTVKAFKNGDIIDMQGVSSWTSNFEIAESYSHKSNKIKQNQRVIFHSNGTKQGTSIKHLAHYDFEDEVLVSTKARWQIDRIEEIDGATHMFLKELEFE